MSSTSLVTTRGAQAAGAITATTGVIELLRNASTAYPAWLDAIASAKEEIVLEMYWFASDRTGWRFASALIDRARSGVDVRILFDAVGSLGTDSAMWAALLEAGAHVIEYHPLAPWRRHFSFSRISQRDHRKILVVDGAVAFAGGINITDFAAPREEGGGGWRDDAVKVTGWAADELRRLFYDTWLRLGGTPPRHGSEVARRDKLALLGAVRALMRTRVGVTGAGSPIQIIGHAALGAHRTMRSLYLWHIRNARQRILITNAYFIPDFGVLRGLSRAARRGVEVRVIVPARSDVPSVQFAGSATFGRMMRNGVHIHLWQDGMIHSKTAVIDDWATVGSYNLDYRSLLYNLEVNVASSDAAFFGSIEASFRDDLTHCRELTLGEWKRRPLKQKFFEWLFFGLRKLL